MPNPYFEDHDVVFWRDSWNDDATAFSFKAGPPEGHSATAKVKAFPDWRLSSGHAHPDSGSFIIWSRGKYLTGDSGYAGVPLTEHHNTVVFDGKGQHKEGNGHDVFAGVSYDRMNGIRIKDIRFDADKVSITADLKAAYEPELGVEHFTRKFSFTAPGEFLIEDDIRTTKPAKITSYLHSDTAIIDKNNGFEFEPGEATLFVEILDPKAIEIVVEKNILTAPGRPGSVDKGEREERGVRLAISTKEKASEFKSKIRLKINH